MTIAEVVNKYGLSADTLRYYERVGIIPPVPRKNGIRNYDDESCRWIELMRCLRSAGVSIDALIEFVTLYLQGDSRRTQGDFGRAARNFTRAAG